MGKRESLLAYDHETKHFRVLGGGNVTDNGDEELKKLNAMAFLNDFEQIDKVPAKVPAKMISVLDQSLVSE